MNGADWTVCPVCGVVVADVVGHRRWHRHQVEFEETTLRLLRGLVELVGVDEP